MITVALYAFAYIGVAAVTLAIVLPLLRFNRTSEPVSSVTSTVCIHQQPGESTELLARRLMDEIRADQMRARLDSTTTPN